MLRVGKKMVLTLLAFATLLGTFVTPVSAFGVNNRERIYNDEYYVSWDDFWEGYSTSEIDLVISGATSDMNEYQSIDPFRVTYRRVLVSNTTNHFTPWRVAGGQPQCGSRGVTSIGVNAGGGSQINADVSVSAGWGAVSVSVSAGTAGGSVVTNNVSVPASMRQNAVLAEIRNQVRVRRYRLYTAGANGSYSFLRYDHVTSNIVAEHRVRTARAVRGTVCPL